MQKVKAKITAGDQVLFEEVDAWVEFSFSGGEPLWNGYFTIPGGGSVKVGKNFTLTDASGRAGRIRISETPPGRDGASQALFKVSGAFAKPQ
jgi:hypothetical protein